MTNLDLVVILCMTHHCRDYVEHVSMRLSHSDRLQGLSGSSTRSL